MRILILGGTIFLGRHLVTEALNKGHELTLFHRGKSNPELFPNIDHIIGDRDSDLEVLKGREWDAVIDTSGYVPRVVNKSAKFLLDKTKHYTFISSISVYKDFSKEAINENYTVGELDDPTVEEVTGETYGPLKAYCEKTVQQIFEDKGLIIRPGLIVGPHDPTDRYTYWVERISKGGDVLIPDVLDEVTQFIDVRDLAKWIIAMVENKQHGVFNATGPKEPLTLGNYFNICKKTLNENASFIPVSESFLVKQGVGEWIELPLWVRKTQDMVGFLKVNCNSAINNGLKFRSLAETIEDTYQWTLTRQNKIKKRAGMTAEREKELLLIWNGIK